MFKLVISDDEGKTTVVPLVRDEITIGRKEGNTIRLTERNVSRRHARLRKSDGAYVLEDLGSYNGVRVNGRRIESESTTPLQPGDQVVIGDYVIALQSEAGDSVATVGASSEPVPPARLVMLTPPAPGAEFALSRDGMRIGRAEDLDIWINHRSISREHAIVHIEGDVFRVTDSESANGMRLNGREVREAVLTSGDVLELGQVRFRFVPSGEIYVFDADRTVQMDAVVLPDEKPSRTPVIAAAVIVLVAVVVGAVIAWSGDPTPTPPEVIEVGNGNGNGTGGTTPPDSPRVTPAEAASRAVAECEEHLEAEEFARASAAATRAMELDPASATARACRDRAAAAARAQETFERGRAALEAGDADTAYFAFEELPQDSPFRERPEVGAARQAFIDSHLRAAREADEPSEAIRHANAVLTTADLSADARREAQSILRSAQRRAPGISTTPMRGTSMTDTSTMTSTMTETATMTETSTMESSGGGGCDPGEVLRGCSYDQRCVANQLRGCANDARTLGVLVEAYKAIRDNAAAERTMRQIIDRFPASRQAAQYRRQLGE
ncbi:MAG: FHA domain-containing protein [Sandaracinus sp.]|nr:FHA domain-containing protein [Sandaracinus sp.]